MITVLITAFREAETIGQAIEAFLSQLPDDAEILVVCPDPATTAIVDDYAARYPAVQHVADPQRGKPVALNVSVIRFCVPETSWCSATGMYALPRTLWSR